MHCWRPRDLISGNCSASCEASLIFCAILSVPSWPSSTRSRSVRRLPESEKHFLTEDLLGFAEAARLAGVAVAIVMLIGHPGRHWIAALHRFLEVSFGVVVAVIVSMLIWPSPIPNRK